MTIVICYKETKKKYSRYNIYPSMICVYNLDVWIVGLDNLSI